MDIYGNKLVNTIETKHRDHFVRRLSVCACVRLSVR